MTVAGKEYWQGISQGCWKLTNNKKKNMIKNKVINCQSSDKAAFQVGFYNFEENSKRFDDLAGLRRGLDSKSMPQVSSEKLGYWSVVKVVDEIRDELVDKNSGEIDPLKCAKLLTQWGGVLIPTRWGKTGILVGNKGQYQQHSVHIYKENSRTSWVYINVDTTVHQFKYQIARELGRVLTAGKMSSQDCDNFSHSFALSLLISEGEMAKIYPEVESEYYSSRYVKHCYPGSPICDDGGRVSYILKMAKKRNLLPMVILSRINEYAHQHKKKQFDLEDLIELREQKIYCCNCHQMSNKLSDHTEGLRSADIVEMAEKLGSDFYKMLEDKTAGLDVQKKWQYWDALSHQRIFYADYLREEYGKEDRNNKHFRHKKNRY